jgi:hypothetical protein
MILSMTGATESNAKRLSSMGRNSEAYQLMSRLLSRPDAQGQTAARWNLLAARLCFRMYQYEAMKSHLHAAYRANRQCLLAAKLLAKFYKSTDRKLLAKVWQKRAKLYRKPRQNKPIVTLPFLRVI